MLDSGLLEDGTSTEIESRQCCSVDGDAGAAFLRKNCHGDKATCTSQKIVIKLLDGLCVFESWRKECKQAC